MVQIWLWFVQLKPLMLNLGSVVNVIVNTTEVEHMEVKELNPLPTICHWLVKG